MDDDNDLPDQSPDEQSPDEILSMAIIVDVGLVVLALLLGWLVGPDPRQFIPEIDFALFFGQFDVAALRPIGIGLFYGAIAAVPLLIFIAAISKLPWQPIRDLERVSQDSVFATLLELRPMEMILISVGAGISEELFFRGWLMYWLAGDGEMIAGVPSPGPYAIVAALMVSSIAFGLVHWITKLYVVLATLMGVYFGALLLLTGNLLVPITAHAVYDAVQLMWNSRGNKPLGAVWPSS